MKLLLLGLMSSLAAHATTADASLEAGFANPPPDCRPEVYWDWMGGLISKEGITKDLEALAAQGVGGVLIMQMPDQTPDPRQWSFREYAGKVKCLSNEYFAMMNHTAAEADRLGLNMSALICPGWSHAGGPWVPPNKGLKKLAFTKTTVTGPMTFSGVLPRPPASQPSRAGNQIPAWNKDAGRVPLPQMNFYQDVAVLAFPDFDGDEAVPLNTIIDLTRRADADGRLTWDVPTGNWTIWRLALISENGLNHPAPPDAMGLECDRMDPEAVQLVFDGMVGRVLREARAKGYRSFKRFETDSYEAGYQDFGSDFQAQFKRLNRYDCTPWLPAWLDRHVIIGNKNLTERFRSDMVNTITALWIERFYGTLRRIADEHGIDWMIEPYWAANLDWRTIAARSAMPGAEFWVHGETLGTAFETAALYGHKVIWAESFSSESYNSAWRNDPWLLKPYADAAFSRGINQLFIHGFTHNPFPDAYQPGLTMAYWGTQMNRHVTWWPYSRAWHEYIARCQYLLRQGLPVNDVLVYPVRPGPVPLPLDGRYRQIGLTDEILLEKLSVRHGRLVLPHGTEFAVLTLVPGERLRPEALEKIKSLVMDGATVIGNPPSPESASLRDYPDCDRRIERLVHEIWRAGTERERREIRLGRGRVISGSALNTALRTLPPNPGDFIGRLVSGDSLDRTIEQITGPPDMVADHPDLRSAHRRAGDAEIWFITHQGDDDAEVQVTFRIVGLQPEWWDPVDGSRRVLQEFRIERNRTTVPLKLAARQSGFVVFRHPARLERTVPNFMIPKVVKELGGAWSVLFDPRWGGPQQVTFAQLEDWSKRAEPGIRYYSGRATYQKSLDLTSQELAHASIFLSLGSVKSLARVRVNGKDLGIVWCAPWRVQIPAGLLREKGNVVEIEVVNTWVNRLIGDEQEPEDCDLEPGNLTGNRKGSYDKDVLSRGLKDLPLWFINNEPRPSRSRFTFTSWRFYDRDAPLQPSGLLGPVLIQGWDAKK